MKKLISKIHWIIIIATLMNVYEIYTAAEEKISKKEAEVERFKLKLKKMKKEKRDFGEFRKNIEAARDKIEIVTKEIERVRLKLPATLLDTEILGALKEFSEKINLKELALAPKTEEDRGFYITKNYEIRGMGTFLQFLVLFEKISENERILNVKSFEMKRIERKQRGRFQVVKGIVKVEAYKYNPNYKSEDALKKASMKAETNANKKLEKSKKKKKRKRRKKK